MAGAFVVGGVYETREYGYDVKVRHWQLVKRTKVMGTFECVETGETCRAKIRQKDTFGGHMIDYEAAYFPLDRGVNTIQKGDC